MDVPLSTLQPAPVEASVVRGAPSREAAASKETAAVHPVRQSAAAAPRTQPGLDALRKVAQQINDFLKSSASSLQFSVDAESDEVVVRVVDEETKVVIRQIPSEEMLAMAKAMDRMSGLLIRQKA